MADWIVVGVVGILIFFMIKNGGCCGGHGKKDNSKSCCDK